MATLAILIVARQFLSVWQLPWQWQWQWQLTLGLAVWWNAISEFAQDFAGTTFGIANTFGSLSGFMAPNIIGWILEANV